MMLNIRTYVVMNRLTAVLECRAHYPAEPVRLWFGSRDLDTGTYVEVLRVIVDAAVAALRDAERGNDHPCVSGACSPSDV